MVPTVRGLREDPQDVSQLVEDGGALPEGGGHPCAAFVGHDGVERAAKPEDRTTDRPVVRGAAEEGICRPASDARALVEVEPGTVEGEAPIRAVGLVVQHPLGETSDDGQSVAAPGQLVASVALLLPAQERLAGRVDPLAELPPEVPGELPER